MVPKSFEIFGEKHRVTFVKKIDRSDSLGEWLPFKNIIRIKRDLDEDIQNQTFWHEVIHASLDHLSYSELSKDEQFVDRISKVIYQVLKSSKY